MAYFAGPDDVYEHIGKLLQELMQDAELVPQFKQADAIVQYRFQKPDAAVTVDLREDGDGRVDLGDTKLQPDVVLSMEADTAHRFWLGGLNPTLALARGDMKAKGPVAKVLKLVPLVKPIHARYRAQLEAAGREDLLAAARG